MGRKKRNSQTQHQADEAAKKAKLETGESFLVKKYRPAKSYDAMEAFVKYTKTHRMLDATYVRWRTGVTTEKPFVFSVRVGGVDLGWGRGKTREAAMDCACRAGFSLVAAHGYNKWDLTPDCFMNPPVDNDVPPPPPPPPPPPAPLPPGLPPLPPNSAGLTPFVNLPPPPHGMPPLPAGLPPPPTTADLIPQPSAVSNFAPTASSLSTNAPTAAAAATTSTESSLLEQPQGTVSLSLNQTSAGNSAQASRSKKLKGGLTLVYDPEGEGSEEMSMEERRALLPRYQRKLVT